MLRFVLRKMVNKKWMVFALLIGNILLVSITCANAMYGKAMLQRTLTQTLSRQLTEENRYPGLISVKGGSTASRNHEIIETAQMMREIPQKFGIDAVQQVESYWIGPLQVKPELQRDRGMASSAALMTMHGMLEHIELVAGEMYSSEAAADGTVDVIVSERGMRDMNLLMGEAFTFPTVVGMNGQPLKVRVCGVFTNKADADTYWVRMPDEYTMQCFAAEEIFGQLFLNGDIALQNSKVTLNGQFYVMLDYTQMRGDQAQQILALSAEYQEHFYRKNGQSYTAEFDKPIKNFLTTQQKVNVTLWVLQIPIFMLLAAFIFMVSGQMLEMEQDEIAVLKSRGVSQKQLVGIYLTESFMMAVIGFAAGVPLGTLIVQVLGSANSFLEFVQRGILPAEVNAQVLLFAAAAAVLAVAAMTIPVLCFAKGSIITRKQKKHRRSDAPVWQKLFIDIVLLLVGLYGLYVYHMQSDILAQRVVDGASLDPLLFISSSAFMAGAGLFALRILPVITFVVFALFRRLWSPAVYAAFLRVIRTRSKQNFIMVFLILTIALGVFNAQAARTINGSEEDNIRYSIGADIVVREAWKDNSEDQESDPEIMLQYVEPDFERYRQLDGAASVTRVLHINNGSMTAKGGMLNSLQVMGVHTREFGETAWMRSDLLNRHFYEYLNALSTNAEAILMSRNFETTYGYKLGDVVYYKNAAGSMIRGIVYGFVDYWPSYQPCSYIYTASSGYQEIPNYLIVANLNHLQAEWGVMPYEVWIKAEGSSQFIYEFAQREGIYFSTFEDAAAQLVATKNDPVFQGTNGILTVGFIVALLMCAVGFLIYWILSIKSRTLQFGIYRAMGMSMKEIISMLLSEQIFISGTSIVTGAAVGTLTAKLYMPLIRMAYTSYDNALPLNVLSESGDMLRLLLVVGGMILFCMLILTALISRMKIAQALKLGED